MNKSIFLSIFSIIILTACTTSQQTITSKSTDIYGAGVIQYPIIAELEVSQFKVEGTARTNRGGSMEALKQTAIVNALQGTNADILVEPVFRTERSGNNLRASVTGFPATYVNFRAITHDDIPLIEAGVLQTVTTRETSQVSANERSNSNTILTFFAILGLLGAAVALSE